MLNRKLPPPPAPAESLYDKIAALKAECEKYVDAAAEADKAVNPGSPLGIYRQMITNKAPDIFTATQMHLDPARFEAEQQELRRRRFCEANGIDPKSHARALEDARLLS